MEPALWAAGLIGGGVLLVVILLAPRWWPAWMALREQKRRLAFMCPGCGYSRTGLPGGGVICPECGRTLEPIDPRDRQCDRTRRFPDDRSAKHRDASLPTIDPHPPADSRG